MRDPPTAIATGLGYRRGPMPGGALIRTQTRLPVSRELGREIENDSSQPQPARAACEALILRCPLTADVVDGQRLDVRVEGARRMDTCPSHHHNTIPSQARDMSGIERANDKDACERATIIQSSPLTECNKGRIPSKAVPLHLLSLCSVR